MEEAGFPSDQGELTGSGDDKGKNDSADVTPPTITYTVTFDANGHGTATDAISIESGKTINEPTAPSADGVTFTGWYRSKEAADTAATDAAAADKEKWDFDKDSVTGDVTLYASWQEDAPKKDGPIKEDAGEPGNATSNDGANVPDDTDKNADAASGTDIEGATLALRAPGTYKILYKRDVDHEPGDANYDNWPNNTTAASGSIVSLPAPFQSKPITSGPYNGYIFTWNWYTVIKNMEMYTPLLTFLPPIAVPS